MVPGLYSPSRKDALTTWRNSEGEKEQMNDPDW